MISKENCSLQVTLPKECVKSLEIICESIDRALKKQDPKRTQKFTKSMFIYSLIVDWFDRHVDSKDKEEAKEVN